jgi:hypothetical protein
LPELKTKQSTLIPIVGHVLLTLGIAAVMFIFLAIYDIFTIGWILMVLSETLGYHNSGVKYPMALVMDLIVVFLGVFGVWAHKWNIFGADGPWSEHAIRNHIAIGIVIGVIPNASLVIFWY